MALTVRDLLEKLTDFGLSLDMNIVLDTDSHNTAFLCDVDFGLPAIDDNYGENLVRVVGMTPKEWFLQFPEIIEFFPKLKDIDDKELIAAFKSAYPEHSGTKVKNNKDKEDMRKQKYRLAKIHNKIKNQRKDFLHKTSRKFINENDAIAIEDLNIEKMKENNYRILNRYIGDAGWNAFINMLFYKAEEAGIILIKVNPRNTSKTCLQCGYINKKLELKDRIYKCPQCNMEINRDYNASLNILGLGLQSLEQAA